MYNVSILRTLIENGWTIANRRAIISKIGKANFDEIINLAHSANITDTFQYSNAFFVIMRYECCCFIFSLSEFLLYLRL